MKPLGYPEFLQVLERHGGRLIVQTVVGRSGSLLLTSLFDHHPEVLMFPGATDYYADIYPRIAAGGSWPAEIRGCLDAWHNADHSNTCRNLGPHKDQTIFYDPDRIIAIMREALGPSLPSRKSIFTAYLYAIGVFLRRDLSKIRCLWDHEHTIVPTDTFIRAILEDFPDARFLCTVRHPNANYSSLLRMREGIGRLGFEGWEYSFSLASRGWWAYRDFLRAYEPFGNRFLFLRLEDLQKDSAHYVSSLAASLGLSDSPTLTESTFAGLTWWGDAFSAPESGVRAPRKATLSPWFAATMDWLLTPEMEVLGYDRRKRTPLGPRLLSLLLFPIWRIDDIKPILTRRYRQFLRREGRPVIRTVVRNLFYIARSYWSLAKQIVQRRTYPGLAGRVFLPPKKTSERRAA